MGKLISREKVSLVHDRNRGFFLTNNGHFSGRRCIRARE